MTLRSSSVEAGKRTDTAAREAVDTSTFAEFSKDREMTLRSSSVEAGKRTDTAAREAVDTSTSADSPESGEMVRLPLQEWKGSDDSLPAIKGHVKLVGITPRIIRFRDAPAYCGMDRNLFNRKVRPHIREVLIGTQGIGFPREDLDAWIDDFLAAHAKRPAYRGTDTWDEKGHPDSFSAERRRSGISTRSSKGGEFERALEQLTCKKPRRSSRS